MTNTLKKVITSAAVCVFALGAAALPAAEVQNALSASSISASADYSITLGDGTRILCNDLDNGTVEIKKCLSTNYNSNVELPEKVYGKSVSKISYQAFANTNIKTVRIPESVQIIDTQAFMNCPNLTDVYYKDCYYADNCYATKYTSYDGVKTVGFQAFYNCPNYKNPSFSACLQNIGNQAYGFSDNGKTIEIMIILPNVIAGGTVYNYAKNDFHCIPAHIHPGPDVI